MPTTRLYCFAILWLGLCCCTTAAQSADLMPVTVTSEPSSGTPAATVRGMVADKAGKPLAGATVVLRAKLGGIQYAGGLQHCRDVLARTTTNEAGEYAFSNIGIPPRLVENIDLLRRGQPGLQVLAWSDGYALAWKDINHFDVEGADLLLQNPAEVSGVALDSDGAAIAEGELAAMGFTEATGDIKKFLNDPGDLNLIRSEVQFTAPVRDGEFSLPNIPPGYYISVRLESPAGDRQFFFVDTGNTTLKQAGDHNSSRVKVPLHRTPIRVTAERLPVVRVKVVDADGNPVAGGGVQAITAEHQYGGSAGVGADGTATMIVNNAGSHKLNYNGDPLHPAVGHSQEVDIQLGGTSIELRLPASQTLNGKVVDGDSGEPVPGVYVAGGGSMAVSGTDGRFTLRVKEGECQLAVRHEVAGYLAPTYALSRDASTQPALPTVTVTPDSAPEEVTLKLSRGLVVEGAVLDERGSSIPGVQVMASFRGQPYRRVATTTDAAGRYRFTGLSPYVPIAIATLSNIGAAEETIAATEDQPWDQTLTKHVDLKMVSATTLVGRVVQQDEPIAGVTVRLHRAAPRDPNERGTSFFPTGETATDEKGKFQLSGLRQGDRYYLEVEPVGDAEVRDWRYASPYTQTVEVANGSTIELPDAVLKSSGQTLAGVVVDPDGNPLEGISVSARFASGRNLSRPQHGPPPWTKTDAEGRFSLTHLPDESLSLMAYKANPAGGRILHPSHVSPAMNADDIRIILDPSLLEEPEDLD